MWASSAPVELYLAAAAAGILLEQPCGAQGTCGRCRVRVVDGAPPPSDVDRDHFSQEELDAGWRLGCRLVLDGAAVIEVPAIGRSIAGKSFGADLSPDALARPLVHTGIVGTPLVPAGSPAVSLLDAVAAAAGVETRALTAAPEALASLALAAADDQAVQVTIHGRELIAVAPAGSSQSSRETRQKPPECYGLAVDLGTTSLAAALVSLADGSVVATASTLNPQVAYGADVISRIRHETHVAGGGAHLAAAAREGLADLVGRLLADSTASPSDVVLASVAGNPTMMHLWLGVSAASLGRAPYVGAWSDLVTVKAAAVALPIHPAANVLVFPLVRSHVGGDAVAAAVATGLDRSHRSRLLIDLGTNTELLLSHGGRIFATSAAAGPAFEGVSIRHGMRGGPGAIDVVSLTDAGDSLVHTVGGVPARGLCGSGLIDAVAELLRVGVLASSGYLRKPGELPAASPWARRLTRVDGIPSFVVADAERADPGAGAIVVTARDVREVQLSKGSIVAAIALLCREAGIEPARLDEVLVAGAFGNCIRKASALDVGLFPDIDPERVRLVGNAAGVGARLALLDREVLERAQVLAARAEYVDLATDPRYQAVFMTALAFPAARAARR
jgi:uncharacterized 2Fe-2S/4Fe-4S cluster protein (DUF4445 family)